MKTKQAKELKKTIDLVYSTTDVHALMYAIENVTTELWEYSNEENTESIENLNNLCNDIDDYISEHEHDDYWEDENNASAIGSDVVEDFKIKFSDIINRVIW